MADLSNMDASTPSGGANLSLGDDEIRAIKNQLLTSFGLEHALTGAHTFQVGATGARPAAGNEGRLYINTGGSTPVLQYDTGSTWVDIADIGALAAHKTQTPIDHPDGSVTTPKIADGAVTSAKLASGSVNTTAIGGSAANLVNSGNADSLHTHTFPTISNPTFIDGTIPFYQDNINIYQMTDNIIYAPSVGVDYEIFNVQVPYNGIISMRFTGWGNVTNPILYSLFINSVAEGQTYNNSTAGYTTVTFTNISVTEGDYVQLAARVSNAGAGALPQIYNFQLMSGLYAFPTQSAPIAVAGSKTVGGAQATSVVVLDANELNVL